MISNCVINLSTDKPRVFTEMARVLRPGAASESPTSSPRTTSPPVQRAERGEWAGCIAGALSFDEYRRGLADAGFVDIELTATSPVADGMHNTIVTARLVAEAEDD